MYLLSTPSSGSDSLSSRNISNVRLFSPYPRRFAYLNFHSPPHDSDGVLWFHVRQPCVCPSVRPSVSRMSVRPFFVSG